MPCPVFILEDHDDRYNAIVDAIGRDRIQVDRATTAAEGEWAVSGPHRYCLALLDFDLDLDGKVSRDAVGDGSRVVAALAGNHHMKMSVIVHSKNAIGATWMVCALVAAGREVAWIPIPTANRDVQLNLIGRVADRMLCRDHGA